MAILSDYTVGTASVAASGTTVTGTGTAWQAAEFREGDWFLDGGGNAAIVASVDSNTSLTLTAPWQGPAITGGAYRLRYMSDGSRVSGQARQLINLLGGSGNLAALGGLAGVAGKVPVFTGPGTMSLTDPGTPDPNGTLTALATIAGAANTMPYFTGAGAAARTDLSAFGRSLIDDANAAAARTTLGATATGNALFTAASAAAARTTLGAQEDLGWRPIQIVNVASAVAAIVVAIPAGVNHLRFSGRVKTSVVTAATLMRLGTGPSTFLATGYTRSAFFAVGNALSGQPNIADTSFIFAYENGDAVLPTSIDGQLDFNAGLWYPRWTQQSAAYQTVPGAANVLGIYHGWMTTVGATPTHLQIFPVSGNLAAGTKILIEGM